MPSTYPIYRLVEFLDREHEFLQGEIVSACKTIQATGL